MQACNLLEGCESNGNLCVYSLHLAAHSCSSQDAVISIMGGTSHCHMVQQHDGKQVYRSNEDG